MYTDEDIAARSAARQKSQQILNARKESLLEALPVNCWPISTQPAVFETPLLPLEGFLLLQRKEQVGSSVQFLVNRGTRGEKRPCRVLLLEPELLDRLAKLVRAPAEVAPETVFARIVEPDLLDRDPELTRFLASLPDLDGEWDTAGLTTKSYEVAPEFQQFPPRRGPLDALLLVDVQHNPRPYMLS